MPTSFFQPGDVADPVYARVRDAETDGSVNDQAHQFIEQMWLETSGYVDEDAPLKARQELMPVCWEMYLAYVLLRNEIVLARRSDRGLKNNKGPDLATLTPKVSIEAVMPDNGSGPDAICQPQPGTAYDIPQEGMMLRIRSVIRDKAARLRAYIDEGIISPTEPTVIAISGAKLAFRLNDAPTPYVVRAALAVGNPVLHLDKVSRKVVGQSLQFQDTIYKSNNAPVRTDPFLGKDFSHVSALLYSSRNCCGNPASKGEEFVIVRNSFAENPLPAGWPSTGTEYWVEDESLHSKLIDKSL